MDTAVWRAGLPPFCVIASRQRLTVETPLRRAYLRLREVMPAEADKTSAPCRRAEFAEHAALRSEGERS